MPHGYNGKILAVNLSDETIEVRELDERWYRTYFGGSGIIGKILCDEVAADVDPLGPDNVLVFACSVVTGAPLAGFNRYAIGAKSPLTGGFARTEAAGFWGPELKFAGFDAIIIRGTAARPVYLWITDGEAQIRDAAGLWGLDNWQTLEQLKADVAEPKARIVSIGPAGENLVSYACVQTDLEHFNGRTGMGAVMGAKNLKAIGVRGTGKLSLADPDKVKEIGTWHRERIKTHPPNIGLHKVGTPGLVKGVNDAGFFPTRNFQQGQFEGAQKLAADAYHDTIFDSRGTCFQCTVACKRRVALDDETYPLDKRFGGPEYESIAAFGSMLAIDDLPAVAYANQRCNLLGLDTISTGGVIAFAMECFENGIITTEDTGGKSLAFGDAEALTWLVEEIAAKRGLGEVLAMGVKQAAAKIGNGAERYAFHIKGQELGLHDGRGKSGMGLGFALGPTGGDHIETPHDVAFQGEGISKLNPMGLLDPIDPVKMDGAKVRFFYVGQKAWGINNLLGLCNFCSVPIHAMTFTRLVEAVQAITGWETSLYEIVDGVERANVLARVFNNRCGFTPDDDTLIRRWFEKMADGPLKGVRFEPDQFRQWVNLYYEMSGWDSDGRPTRGKLFQLGLDWLPEASLSV
ncbi:MAG: aldehyde ferredoxin oxidoreductase family protein [Desulfofustis sp. PB-SRB1]|jgi:aldehyde:ferredoxin oxidoreductase|nr:aldehyde ferredoxin oxidoreductase family protein [Desulfofustis sp. PB-SRB1]MBM1001925.1 aldehyde ferredoxin oxidoreductase family protein [Desulfofustis sp. PB-SRB1]HBH27742.1 aldehyde ferredoxin oxidoreductase [Desulfofustis sp.]HBH31341.1 aldehyde ferredoxin oxidoreductase [Desulfofustis sp.]